MGGRRGLEELGVWGLRLGLMGDGLVMEEVRKEVREDEDNERGVCSCG